MHKRHRHLIKKILGFHLEDSTRYQNNAFNKAIARYNQLTAYLEFSP
jgi:hypothetical protein